MTNSKDIYLGVDGGNSGTRALLIDADGRVCGYGQGGNANYQGQGLDAALGHVTAAIDEACQTAGLALGRVAHAYLALAGDDTVDDHALLTVGLRDALPGLAFALGNDVWAGLRAGSVGGVGVAVNCGSGTGTVGRNARGETVIIPDLGYAFGDSGGGVQIAVDAFRAVIRAWDGRGEPTALTALLLDLTGLPDVEQLYLEMHRRHVGRDVYRAATRLVFQAAAGGDAVAAGILRRIGTEMGTSAAAVARRLALQGERFPLVLTGGTFRTLRSPLAAAVIERLHAEAPRAEPTLPLLHPVAGAVLLALDAAGAPVSLDHYERLRRQGYGWHPEESFDS